MYKTSPAIGIDLGTTCCCVGYFNERTKQVEIIDNKLGHKTTPSYVAFNEDDESIGKLAKDKVVRMPKKVIYDSKRLIGQQYSNQYLEQDKHNWPFDVSTDKNNDPLIHVFRKGKLVKYKPQEISAMLLSYMKTTVEERLEVKIRDAVVTVPAYFNYHQRKATVEAANLAQLNVLQMINEPTAAALAYVHRNEVSDQQRILIFDLGGGTLDVSIVAVQEGSVTVQATSGNTHLGGRDFENNLAKLIVDKIKKTYDKDVENDKEIMRIIIHECEKLKVSLSFEMSTDAEFRSLFDQQDVDVTITRKEFEEVNMGLFENCLTAVKNCLHEANLKQNHIDNIVLIGGSTRIPIIQKMLSDFFGRRLLTKTINPEEAVAQGASIQASMLKNRELKNRVTDLTSLSLGMELNGGIMEIVVPRKTRLPTVKSSTYFTITDKQRIADINIFEGERHLTSGNTKIGTCLMELPPRPPGYPIEVSFYVNESGLLEVGVKTHLGIYKTLTIEPRHQTEQTLHEIFRTSKQNKEIDGNMFDIINRCKSFQNYCTRMRAICTYDKKGLTDEEKNIIENSCVYHLSWLNNNQVTNGTVEGNDITCMQKAMEVVCEPIVNKYKYFIKDMNWKEFHRCITE